MLGSKGLIDPNHLDLALKNQLNEFKWTPSKFLDLHELGVHFFTPEYLPTDLDPMTYAALYARGITPPNALPIYVAPDCHERIKHFLATKYYKLAFGGVGYLGNEFNVQPGHLFDKAKVKICICRLSPYRVMEGSFGAYLLANFINDYSSDDEIFLDFAYQPEDADIPFLYEEGLPFYWGTSSKHPLTDFDIVIFGTSYAGERVNLPLALVKSGIPLHRWERFDASLPYHSPDVLLAGIGASCSENVMPDNPVKGVGENSFINMIINGEGELADLKYAQLYSRMVKDEGHTLSEFHQAISNKHFKGCYSPTDFLFTYKDKLHIQEDFEGNVISETLYEGGGGIEEIFLLDRENKVKYSLAGPNSEEFKQMELPHRAFIKQLSDRGMVPELSKKYVK